MESHRQGEGYCQLSPQFMTHLMGKARLSPVLSPVKTITIPRLELTAATVSVYVAQMLKKEIDSNPQFKSNSL